MACSISDYAESEGPFGGGSRGPVPVTLETYAQAKARREAAEADRTPPPLPPAGDGLAGVDAAGAREEQR